MYWAAGEAHQSSLVPEEAFMSRFDQAILTDRHQESGILGIFTESGVFIGEVSYRDMDVVAGTAVLGIMIGDKSYWGQGYGTDAVRTLCRFLFDRFDYAGFNWIPGLATSGPSNRTPRWDSRLRDGCVMPRS